MKGNKRWEISPAFYILFARMARSDRLFHFVSFCWTKNNREASLTRKQINLRSRSVETLRFTLLLSCFLLPAVYFLSSSFLSITFFPLFSSFLLVSLLPFELDHPCFDTIPLYSIQKLSVSLSIISSHLFLFFFLFFSPPSQFITPMLQCDLMTWQLLACVCSFVPF